MTNSKRKVNPVFVYIGNGNYVQSDNIFAVLKNSGNPAKATRQLAETEGRLLHMNGGQPALSLLMTTHGAVIKCAVSAKTMARRMNQPVTNRVSSVETLLPTEDDEPADNDEFNLDDAYEAESGDEAEFE